MNDLVFREVKLLGSLGYANDHRATIEMIASGKVDPFQFITGRIALEDIVKNGFEELVNNEGGERKDPRPSLTNRLCAPCMTKCSSEALSRWERASCRVCRDQNQAR
jgi:hypothetical protein